MVHTASYSQPTESVEVKLHPYFILAGVLTEVEWSASWVLSRLSPREGVSFGEAISR
jgi:hypothetical protein